MSEPHFEHAKWLISQTQPDDLPHTLAGRVDRSNKFKSLSVGHLAAINKQFTRALHKKKEMDSLARALMPYREVIGNVAGMLTIAQFLSGCFTCNKIRLKGSSEGFSALQFVFGCGL